MNFNSLEFLIFLVVVLLLYWLIPHKFRWVILLVASLYFYMSWNPPLVFLMLGTMIVSYGAALAISKTKKKAWKKFWMIMALVVCLGVLIFFKYFEFFLNSAVDFLNLFSMNLDSFSLNLLLPIGISFYTFQTLSYVIDVYRGDFEAEKHFGYYALFVCYFPQLVAGPIERPGDLLPQLKQPHKFNRDDFITGFRILIIGFYYKCVVADFCGVYVNNVFNNLDSANGLAIVIGSLLFCVQIYCDFVGYSEIATGAARMMGVKLTRNFNRPYLATSFTDLFRRWHLTLTRWFTDYVYIPLGGNRKGKARKLLNILIVFVLCGLWHGANWTYVLWGLYCAFLMMLENILKKPTDNFFIKRGIDPKGSTINGCRRALMFVLYVFSAIIFRSTSIEQVGIMLGKLFTEWGVGEAFFNATMDSLGLNMITILQLVMCILCLIQLFDFGEIGRDANSKPLATLRQDQGAEIRSLSIHIYTIAIIALSWLLIIATQDSSAFLYFQF